MKDIIIKTSQTDFIVHSSYKSGIIEGMVYELDTLEDGRIFYRYKDSSECTEKKREARCFLEFQYMWRGIWEGRVYFKDDEYWSGELKDISNMWDELKPKLKQKIKEENPENQYD